jgi:hypothetical protein
MDTPYIKQFFEGARLDFEMLWKSLLRQDNLRYWDFQVSSVWDFQKAGHESKQRELTADDLFNISDQEKLDDLYLIYYTDRELFKMVSYSDYLKDHGLRVFMRVMNFYDRVPGENVSQYCLKLKVTIETLSEILEVNDGKWHSKKVRYLLDDLILKLEVTTKKVGTEDFVLGHKIKWNWSRDKIVGLLYLLLENKVIEGLSRKELSNLISLNVDSTVGDGLSAEIFRKRLSTDYSKEPEYKALLSGWTEFEDVTLTKMAKLVRLKSTKSSDKNKK